MTRPTPEQVTWCGRRIVAALAESYPPAADFLIHSGSAISTRLKESMAWNTARTEAMQLVLDLLPELVLIEDITELEQGTAQTCTSLRAESNRVLEAFLDARAEG